MNSLGRPKKYEGSVARLGFCVPKELKKQLSDFAERTGSNMTEIIIEALQLLSDTNFKKQFESQNRIVKFQKTDSKYNVLNRFLAFDIICFSDYPKAKGWCILLSKELQKAQTTDLEEEILDGLELRLNFLYDVAMPDLYRFLYKENVKLDRSLWYNFKIYFENGCSRPPPPKDWFLSDVRRERQKETEKVGLQYGHPKIFIDQTKNQDQLTHQDEEFNKLLEWAEDTHSETGGKEAPTHKSPGRTTSAPDHPSSGVGAFTMEVTQ